VTVSEYQQNTRKYRRKKTVNTSVPPSPEMGKETRKIFGKFLETTYARGSLSFLLQIRYVERIIFLLLNIKMFVASK